MLQMLCNSCASALITATCATHFLHVRTRIPDKDGTSLPPWLVWVWTLSWISPTENHSNTFVSFKTLLSNFFWLHQPIPDIQLYKIVGWLVGQTTNPRHQYLTSLEWDLTNNYLLILTFKDYKHLGLQFSYRDLTCYFLSMACQLIKNLIRQT